MNTNLKNKIVESCSKKAEYYHLLYMIQFYKESLKKLKEKLDDIKNPGYNKSYILDNIKCTKQIIENLKKNRDEFLLKNKLKL